MYFECEAELLLSDDLLLFLRGITSWCCSKPLFLLIVGSFAAALVIVSSRPVLRLWSSRVSLYGLAFLSLR